MAMKDRNRGRVQALSLTMSGQYQRGRGLTRNPGAQPCAATVSPASDNPRVTRRGSRKRGDHVMGVRPGPHVPHTAIRYSIGSHPTRVLI